MKIYLYFILMLTLFSCKKTASKNNFKVSENTVFSNTTKELNYVDKKDTVKKLLTVKNKQNIIHSTIDSVSLAEIKQYIKPQETVYNYYCHDDEEIWSDKMFGRCCTEADLLYSELLGFNISSNINNSKYPFSNLSDRKYLTAYVFQDGQDVEISLKLKKESEYHKIQTNFSVDEVLRAQDTILYPFKLSMVNGYVKSGKTFLENARVKEMKLFLNGDYKATIKLKDTPLVQEFKVDLIFSKNDVVKLTPTSYYPGTKYNDVCISEIQSSLAHITHPSINNKYIISELFKK